MYWLANPLLWLLRESMIFAEWFIVWADITWHRLRAWRDGTPGP